VNTTGFISTTIGRPDGHDCHLFMTIWRLHKHDWCHTYNHLEAAWQRLVSFLRPLGGRTDTNVVMSSSTGRPRRHSWCHFNDHREATRTRLASYLRPLGGRMNTTVVISMTTGRPSRYDLSHFYNHWGRMNTTGVISSTTGRPRGHDWYHFYDHIMWVGVSVSLTEIKIII